MKRFPELSRTAGVLFATALLTLAVGSSAAAVEAPYRLGPGDLLQISVWGQEELRAAVEVRPDGYITFPLAGEVQAAGKTPAEVSQVIASRLEAFVRSPQVTVIVQQFRTLRVQALGAVRQPGAYLLRPGALITDLLGAAGGLLDDADAQRAVLTRQRLGEPPRTLAVDLRAVLEGTAPADSALRLEDGDVLFVPRAEPALILGEVRQPGAYLVRPGMRVVDLVGAAGGLTERAAAEAATLTRRTAGAAPSGQGSPGETIPLDLSALTLPGALGGSGARALPAAAAVEVRPGDVLLIPRADREVAILGEVQRPGVVPYRAGMTLAQALAAAGGVTQEADPAGAVLTRTEADGSRRVISVDLRPVVEPGSAGAGELPALMPGDMLVVPRAQRTLMVLGEVRQPGVVRYRTGMTVAEALAEAGGPTDLADLARASITRLPGSEPGAPGGAARRMEVDLSSLAGGWAPGEGAAPAMTAAAMAVQPGDILLIPRAQRDVVVLGAVQRPGSYPLRPGARVLDALAAAGGLTEEADPSAITLVRPAREGSPTGPAAGGADDSKAGQPLDYEAMLRSTADPAVNPPVLPGDVVVVGRTDPRVLALGAVTSPGSFRYREGLTVLDLLAQAGGARPNADPLSAVLTRADGKTVHLNLQDLVQNPASPGNVALKPGDVLFVPESRQVLVLGEVARPGAYTAPAGGRVLDVLAMAGGVRPDAGVTTVVLTRRPSEASESASVFRLDYASLVSGADASLNMRLENGDVLYVPEGRNHVLVLGQVQRPGLYVLPSPGPVRLLDVLALAGGPTRRAVLDAVGILRVDGRTEQAAAGRGATLFQGQASENPVVQPGDVVYVPETRWPDWSQILGVLQSVRVFQEIIQGFQK